MHLNDHSKLYGTVITGFQYGANWGSGGSSSDIPTDIACTAVQGPLGSSLFSTYYSCPSNTSFNLDELRAQLLDFNNWNYSSGGSNINLPIEACEPSCINCIELEIDVLLEGAIVENDNASVILNEMRTDLFDTKVLPGQLYFDGLFGFSYSSPGQPYNNAPWNYSGSEGALFDSQENPNNADAGYDPDVVDWVLVSLRTDIAPESKICEAAGLLHKDGNIEFVQALSCCELDQSLSYFLVVEHRNHLIVMTKNPVGVSNGVLTHDFSHTDSYGGVFGIEGSQKEITLPNNSVVFTMYGGNGNQIGGASATDINVNDKTIWEGNNNQIGIYNAGDFNLSSDINVNDKTLWEINNSTFSSVPR